ncbi:hypothetical protein Pcinc_025807 [Petrolisthes cinctipes]|uniref:Uncharacterized protein n=1 Tax=Petrolisthes cinctipes TaxID=88211 RepID=A0AAE1F748_PETCI|nr:hypothetical protein Pcinc_025807 [Petrolisthes cinctipes]
MRVGDGVAEVGKEQDEWKERVTTSQRPPTNLHQQHNKKDISGKFLKKEKKKVLAHLSAETTTDPATDSTHGPSDSVTSRQRLPEDSEWSSATSLKESFVLHTAVGSLRDCDQGPQWTGHAPQHRNVGSGGEMYHTMTKSMQQSGEVNLSGVPFDI